MVEKALFKISGCSFTAVPNDIIDERSKIVLPDLVLEGKNIALDIKKMKSLLFTEEVSALRFVILK